VGSRIETATPVLGTAVMPSESEPRAAVGAGRLLFDLFLTMSLLALLVFGASYVWPAISSPGTRKTLSSVLISALLIPIAPVVLLSFIERLFPPAGPRKSLSQWFLHLHIHVFYIFMAGIAAALNAVALSALARHFGFHLGLINMRFASGKGLLVLAAAVWVSMVVGDFFFYWFHRALHKSKILWQHHKLHHIDEQLEAITLNRQNWIEVFIAALLIFAPVALLFKLDKPDPTQLGLLAGTFATVLGTFLGIGHMNVRFQVGKASLLYCSPQVHRIHHSRLPQHQDRNFAFALPLWDVLFGTYYAPQRDEFPPTGVDGEKEIKSFWEAQIFTQREWWRMFRRWRERSRGAPA
jgi:sterol desaturase/sphingolipid hydroxylase (fatty acid hydroxylase superfamily)